MVCDKTIIILMGLMGSTAVLSKGPGGQFYQYAWFPVEVKFDGPW